MRLLETADAARTLNVVPATIRALARTGRLRVAATTPRGTRLFRARDVERLRRVREAREDMARPKRWKTLVRQSGAMRRPDSRMPDPEPAP